MLAAPGRSPGAASVGGGGQAALKPVSRMRRAATPPFWFTRPASMTSVVGMEVGASLVAFWPWPWYFQALVEPVRLNVVEWPLGSATVIVPWFDSPPVELTFVTLPTTWGWRCLAGCVADMPAGAGAGAPGVA